MFSAPSWDGAGRTFSSRQEKHATWRMEQDLQLARDTYPPGSLPGQDRGKLPAPFPTCHHHRSGDDFLPLFLASSERPTLKPASHPIPEQAKPHLHVERHSGQGRPRQGWAGEPKPVSEQADRRRAEKPHLFTPSPCPYSLERTWEDGDGGTGLPLSRQP